MNAVAQNNTYYIEDTDQGYLRLTVCHLDISGTGCVGH